MPGRISVDRSLCDGNGLCVAEAPGYFLLDADYELQLLQEYVAPGDEAAVARAIDSCPKAALRMEQAAQ